MFCVKSAGRLRLVPSTAGGAVGAGGGRGGSTIAGRDGRAAIGGGRSAVVAGGNSDGDGGALVGLLELGDLDGLADALEGHADDLQSGHSVGGGESSGAAAGLGAQDDLAHLLKDLSVDVLALVGRAAEVADGGEGTAAATAAAAEAASAASEAASEGAATAAAAGPGVVVPRGWLSAGQSGQASEQHLETHSSRL